MDAAAARDHLCSERRAFVDGVLDCATAVAEDLPTRDRERVVGPFRATLERAGLLSTAPSVLASCVRAAGGQLQASPVAAPPYVVVTSTGLVLRATQRDERLVVRVEPFAVERDPTRYVHRDPTPEEAVSVAVRTS